MTTSQEISASPFKVCSRCGTEHPLKACPVEEILTQTDTSPNPWRGFEGNDFGPSDVGG